MKSNLFALVAVAVLGAVLLQAAGLGYENQAYSPTERVVNESITVDYSQPIAVNVDASRYRDNEVLYNKSTTRLNEGIDYTWNTTSGEVSWSNTSRTTDLSTAYITYTPLNHSDSTQDTKGLLASFSPILGLLTMIAALGVLWGLIKTGGGF